MAVSRAHLTSKEGPVQQRRARPEQLQAIVLLGGNVRTSRFGEAIGRSILDLPVEKDQTLLAFWQTQAQQLVRGLGLDRMSMRLMLDRSATEPAAALPIDGVVLSVERDPYAYRGTGGVLRDLAGAYADDDYLLVANAGQLLGEPLTELASELLDRGGDVTVVAHTDGAPSGLMVVRCGALREIPAAGFSDMKEQALPLIAKSHRVEVVQKRTASAVAIRNVQDYISALRRHHRRLAGDIEETGAFAEEWRPVFQIVEDGASAEGARIHDSVVLRGARVQEGAVIVRSVICSGTFVPSGRMLAEDVVQTS
jgi:mannose-1-phosphate guanylyltransferase